MTTPDPSSPPQESAAARWVSEFMERLAEFKRARGLARAAVRIVLAGNVEYFAQRVAAGPGESFLTIDVYPEDPEGGMVTMGEGAPRTPMAIVVPITTLMRFELLDEAPLPHSVGFVLNQDRDADAGSE